MSNTKTGIEWCDVTWNPVTGCEKVSQGCKNCYAERVFDRMAQNPKAPMYHGRKFTDVVCHPERLNDPLRWKKPRRVFVNSMSDLFHEDVPDEFILRVVDVMRQCQQHTFIILTKRPERMRDFTRRCRWSRDRWYDDLPSRMWLSGNPDARNGFRPFGGAGCTPWPNIWLGVSVEDQATADERIPILLQTPAKVRFVSYEPALGPLKMENWFARYRSHCSGLRYINKEAAGSCTDIGGLDWVIAGGESGPNARPPHPDWFRKVRDQCKAANVPFFFKQWGEWAESGYGFCDHHGKWVHRAGGTFGPIDGEMFQPNESAAHMIRVGKKRAGRLLDGVEHNEFPEVRK